MPVQGRAEDGQVAVELRRGLAARHGVVHESRAAARGLHAVAWPLLVHPVYAADVRAERCLAGAAGGAAVAAGVRARGGSQFRR